MLRRELSPGPAVPRLRFRGPHLHVPLWLLAAGWLLNRALAGTVWLVRHPRSALVLAGAVLAWAVWLRWGWAPYGWGGSCAAVLLGVWWARWPESFARQVTGRARSRWRWLAVYRRDWQPAMVTSGLSLTPGLGGSLPTLRRVRAGYGRDVLRVRMLPGQTLEQWQAAAPKLATTWSVRGVRVRRVTGRPRDLDVVCLRRIITAAEVPHAAATPPQPVEIPAVTKPGPPEDPQPATPTPGPFPRAPRRASRGGA